MVAITGLPAAHWDVDPIAHTEDRIISTAIDASPGGSAHLVLERLTLPPGGALPVQEASPFVWVGVQDGALGLTLEGERLPFRWKSGAERTFRPGQYLPPLPPGTRMTPRNAGDTPLVLYRLTVIPREAQAADAVLPRCHAAVSVNPILPIGITRPTRSRRLAI